MNVAPLTKKKTLLDARRPLPEALLRNLDDWFRVELTYTSNAIEGNTLTRRETAMVVEKGLTVGGKTLVEHIEATNHAAAVDWIRERAARKPRRVDERDILDLHAMVLKGIDDTNAGRYRNMSVRISGSMVVFPNPAKVPALMEELSAWLRRAVQLHPVERAAEGHYRLVTIHPFTDGNGRTARLLMNLILMMAGYPPAIIQKRERLAYIGALEKAQLGGPHDDYRNLIARAVDRSLDIYLTALDGKTDAGMSEAPLLKIGALAKRAAVTTSTIRHWTKEGLLDIAETTPSGYQLYAETMVDRVAAIRALQERRYTLEEIREALRREE